MSKQHNKKKEIKKIETFSVIGLIVFALISFYLTNITTKSLKSEILIFSNGKQITEIKGSKINNKISGTFKLYFDHSAYNVLEIDNGKIRCIDSNCPDKICVSHSFLNPDIDNDMIVCAPHKLIIQYK